MSKLVDFIDNELPGVVDTTRGDTEKCVEYYTALEEYGYRMPVEDLNRRWLIFAGPRDIKESGSSRKKDLDKLKHRYNDDMVKEQEEFKAAPDKYDDQVTNFYQFANINNHAEVAEKVEDIHSRLTD